MCKGNAHSSLAGRRQSTVPLHNGCCGEPGRGSKSLAGAGNQALDCCHPADRSYNRLESYPLRRRMLSGCMSGVIFPSKLSLPVVQTVQFTCKLNLHVAYIKTQHLLTLKGIALGTIDVGGRHRRGLYLSLFVVGEGEPADGGANG